ncbi:MAG: DUF4387 domain-containing protein [Actinomycetia bacterium]|nr:DUF4387 domain-containing protein [Actinomycetes bacterium]
MTTLAELAKLIRSKNAGPFQLTVDIMFADEETYERVLAGGAINAERLAAIYGVEAERVRVIPYAAAHSIKVTLPRPVVSGDPGDGDTMGGQQYAPLVDLEVDRPPAPGGDGSTRSATADQSTVREQCE